MSFLSNLEAKVSALFKELPTLLQQAEHLLETALTPAHIEAGLAAVAAVQSKGVSNWEKMGTVANSLRAFEDLSPQANDSIGMVVGALATVAKARGLIVAAHPA